MEEEKIKALSKFLECAVDDLIICGYDEDVLKYGCEEYLVLSDDEADERAREYILDSIWAFNPDFIAGHTKPGFEIVDLIKEYQKKCESANEGLKALIEDLDYFIDDAISSDGRGHFISAYDGDENEEGEYFIYRVN